MERAKKERHLKMLSVRVPEELSRAVKVYAAASGSNVQAVVLKALEAYLKAHKAGAKQS